MKRIECIFHQGIINFQWDILHTMYKKEEKKNICINHIANNIILVYYVIRMFSYSHTIGTVLFSVHLYIFNLVNIN